MEFHEKLQELRKSRGLTQEELAQDLYVSRTAISKWESGRGYPSIDSLKEISNYFSVTIDDLLSSEKLLSIAEKEYKSNLRNMCDLIFGIIDIGSFILILLPLYPNEMNGFIYSVNLFAYTQTTYLNRIFYWILYGFLIAIGIIKIILIRCGMEKCNAKVYNIEKCNMKICNIEKNNMKVCNIETYNKISTSLSVILSILGVIFLVITRNVYAGILIFMLLVFKGILIFKSFN